MIRIAIVATLMIGLTPLAALGAEKPIKVLFLGDQGHHRPADRFRQLQPVLAKRGIEMTYSGDAKLLDAKGLAEYDVLAIYANTTKIEPNQEQALLEFVESGKGFVPIHCASYCFLNSPKYIELVGAQFRRHGTGTFRTTSVAADHPIMKGFTSFESWDETYEHTKHNEQGRTVLEVRPDGDRKEPWTWVRTQGKGRVFYTAWGHDHRTWGTAGFQELIERGIRWSAGRDPSVATRTTQASDPTAALDVPFPVPQMTEPAKDARPFEYVDVGKKIPNYTPGRQWGTQGEPHSKMQKPLPPDESAKHMVVPKGFHVELFLAEDQLPGGKPLCMNWDERGRLWVGASVDYPNDLVRSGEGRDRIYVCEDTDGDYRADKVTQFADKLSIPATMTFHRGGVLVQNGTQTLYLKDTDGDGRADERRVVFTGWGMGDTHGGVSNFQYGLDNWIWAMQGYNNSRPVGPNAPDDDRERGFRQGFFRYRPDGSQLEFLRSTDNNTWGLGLSEEGIVFGSTANRNPSVYLPIPNRYYESVRGWTPSLVLRMISDTYLFKPVTDKVRQVDQHGGYTAAAGHSLYTARTYPKEYWNRVAFVCEPTGHLVGMFVINRQGSDFRSTNSFNLVASYDEWTAPIAAEVGPDGNVWIIDWYNFIVQHNPTPIGFRTGRGAAYESDLRDKKHGRVYRVVYDAAPKAERISLAGASSEKLVATLRHPNLLWRRHAQRLLVELGERDVAPALVEMLGDQKMDEIGLNVGVIHALWTLEGLDALTADAKNEPAHAAAVACLKHASPGVRRNAAQVLARVPNGAAAILQAGLLADPHPQVRLAALLALADAGPTPGAGGAIVQMLSAGELLVDRWILDAAISAAAKHSDDYLRALTASRALPLAAVGVTPIVAEHYARGGPDSVAGLLASLASAEPSVADVVVRGLARGWPKNKQVLLDEAAAGHVQKLLGQLPPASRGQLVKLAASWGSKQFERFAVQVREDLLKQLGDASADDSRRIAAATELVGLGGDGDVVTQILDVITPQASPQLAAGVLGALQGSASREVGTVVVDRLSTYTPTIRAAGISLLLSRPELTHALLDAIDRGRTSLADLSLDQRQMLASHLDGRIRRRAQELLRRGGALPNLDRQKVIDEWLPVTKVKGNAAAGADVFKKTCVKCHTHSGEGERIGPDLTGMAVHPKSELLLQILDPSRNVEGNYRVYRVLTLDGQSVVGLLASESKTTIELFDAEAKKQTLLRDDIDRIVADTVSLMPDGFEKQISREQMTDLLEFLTARGKYLPLDLAKVATTTSVKGMFYDPEADAERLIFDDWKPKTFRGVPFQLVDPRDGRTPNVVLLYGPQGTIPPKMPRRVELPCKMPVKAIHLLSGVAGWAFPYEQRTTVSMIVRLHYADGTSEDHELRNGEHFADYIRRFDVPRSEFAFAARRQQIRYLAVQPKRSETIDRIELVKGPDRTAPVVMAVTVEPLADATGK
jgi:putative membrane-bound dehydrogenase-like protein